MTILAKAARLVVLAIAVSVGLGVVAIEAVWADVLYRWVQLAPADPEGKETEVQVLVRAIVGKDAPCPKLGLGGSEAQQMEKRNKPESGFDDIQVCETAVASAAEGKAFFDGRDDVTVIIRMSLKACP